MFRIAPETKIGELLKNMPEAAEILANMGMHCPTCPSAQNETLEQACDVHDFDVTVDEVTVGSNVTGVVEGIIMEYYLYLTLKRI